MMSLKYDQFFGNLSAVVKTWFSSAYCKGIYIKVETNGQTYQLSCNY